MTDVETHNLPAQVSTFIGREKEIAELNGWLATHRLVTLTGAGGSGKTRLALETARGLLPKFPGGVWLVDLTPVADPGLVAQVTATAVGAREQPAHTLSDALVDHLRRRPTLLLFDNCEHLVAASAQLATTLLQSCPDLQILATSREPLGVTGEVAWGVPLLSLPAAQPWRDPASSQHGLLVYQQSEAVRLFVARATTVFPTFTLTLENGAWVAEICRRLDGMPLAIELAAARVRALSVREIAQRLNDRFELLTAGSRTAPPRQQTLTATLDWSYKLLSEAERTVLQRLAVPAGGCTLAAAEAVCADDDSRPGAVLDVLSQLVDKSLVVADQTADGTRYRLLETIRHYAQDKLLASGELERVRARHCAYYLAWAEQAQTHLTGPDQLAWLDRYEAEHDNLRAALEWCRGATSTAVTGLRLANACAHFWRLHAYGSEGTGVLVPALTAAGMCAPTEARAWALSHVARLAYLRSDFPVMRTYGEEALSLWRRLGRNGRTGLAFTLKLLGELATEEGDYEHALGLFEEALGIYRELDDVYGIGEILMQFGWAAMRTGNDTQAAAHLEEFLAVAQQGEDTRGIAFALSGLGELSVRQGDYERAIALLEKSLRLNRAGGYRWMTATVLGSLGWIALARTDYKRMRALLGESLSIRLEIGDRGGTAWCLEKLGEEELARGKTALTSVRLMRLGRAVRIFAAAANLRAPIKSAIDPVDQSDHARNLAVLRAGLGEAAYAAAWAEGSAMSVDAAVDYALAEPTPSVDSVPPQTGHAGDRVGGLTRRECEVATLIAQGKSNREIAQALTVGVKTVETYVMRIFDKLGFDSRVQVATWAFNNGLAGSPRRSDA